MCSPRCGSGSDRNISDRVEQRRDRLRHDEKQARVEWWRRSEWAVELALSDDDATEATGIETLEALVLSPLQTPSEFGIVEIYLKNRGGIGDGSQ